MEKAGGEGGIFLRIIHPRYGQWKVLQKKLIKTNILPLKKGEDKSFFSFFPSCLWESWNLTAIWQLSCSVFFMSKRKEKKIEGGIFGDFFSFEGGTMVFLYVQFYILHSYMCILTNFRTLLLLNGRDKIMMKRNN